MSDSKEKTGSLLDRLRKQSDAVRATETPRRSTEEILVDMDKRLWRAYRWLDEALAHLSVIKPVVAHEFRVESLFTLSGLQVEQGFVSYRRRHLGASISSSMSRCSIGSSARSRSRSTFRQRRSRRSRAACAARHRVSLRGEAGRAQGDHRGTFTLTPAVTGSVRFDPDYRRHEIGVHLTNVDRFETVHLDFKPERFDEAALEDLVRLVLGESNSFLRRAPLSGIGAGKRAAAIEEPVVYRVERTMRNR